MIGAIGRPALRGAVLLAALSLLWLSLMASGSDVPTADAWLFIPAGLALAGYVASWLLRVEKSGWRPEPAFVAATYVALGGSWALATFSAGLLCAWCVRGVAFRSGSLVREAAGLIAGLTCAWISRFIGIDAGPALSVILILVWRGVMGFPGYGRTKLGAEVFALALLAMALAGLVQSPSAYLALAGVFPAAFMFSCARAEQKTSRSVDDTLTALALMLQRAHPYTHGHIERVARIAETTARKLGLSEERASMVRAAAWLHDIGKVAIDEQILDKPDKLSPEEMAHVQLHAPIGAAILEEIENFRQVATWVKHHHERPDGSGYPSGLKDEAIPLESKIIAVADAFDAMTSGWNGGERRPYRSPISPAQAVVEMEQCAGSQFDARVVRAFRDALGEEETA